MVMPLITVVTPCFNEEENVAEVYAQVKAVFGGLPQYDYEHLFIDNASTDGTVAILRGIAREDPRVRVIVNARNFGHIRSPYYAILQARGDAVIGIAGDLQDPPTLIPEFVKRWEAGYKIVLGIKETSGESRLMFVIRGIYYKLLRRLSDVDLIEHFTGFGLYDRQVIDILRSIKDSYPYFRGLIADIGFESAKISYRQPKRTRGLTKNSLYTLFDLALLGMTSHTKVPLRLATLVGFACAVFSMIVSLGYLVYKLIYWKEFSVGVAPLVIGVFFLSSVQLFFLGIVGEYIGSIHTQVLGRPLVVEKERINFAEEDEAEPTTARPDDVGRR
jgi:glycosyltransferase involved in cell wall biosynthesis